MDAKKTDAYVALLRTRKPVEGRRLNEQALRTLIAAVAAGRERLTAKAAAGTDAQVVDRLCRQYVFNKRFLDRFWSKRGVVLVPDQVEDLLKQWRDGVQSQEWFWKFAWKMSDGVSAVKAVEILNLCKEGHKKFIQKHTAFPQIDSIENQYLEHFLMFILHHSKPQLPDIFTF